LQGGSYLAVARLGDGRRTSAARSMAMTFLGRRISNSVPSGPVDRRVRLPP